MRASTTSDLSSAIIVNADDLARLWGYVVEFTGTASATVGCKDGVDRSFDDLGQFLRFENTPRSSIHSISLYGSDKVAEKSMSIFVGRRLGSTVSVSIRGEERDVETMRGRVVDSLSGMRAWYSRVATMGLFSAWLGVLVGIYLALAVIAPSDSPQQAHRSFVDTLGAAGLTLGKAALIALVVLASHLIKRRFFPVVTVAIGQGVRRHQIDENVRWGVIVAFVVSIAAAIALS